MTTDATIHATAVLIGARSALIRGPAGAGKSHLALRLIEAGQTGLLRFARLVADDRVHVQAINGRLLVRPAERLAGLIEARGLGLRRLPFEPVAMAGLVIDLNAVDAERLPRVANRVAVVEGVSLPRLAVAPGLDPLPQLWAHLATAAADV
jgi:serine kinase of HPr protein (carbohydrate metabolism regulator)